MGGRWETAEYLQGLALRVAIRRSVLFFVVCVCLCVNYLCVCVVGCLFV